MVDKFIVVKEKIINYFYNDEVGKHFIDFREHVVESHKDTILPWLMTLSDSEILKMKSSIISDELYLSRYVLLMTDKEIIDIDYLSEMLKRIEIDITIDSLRRKGLVTIDYYNKDSKNWNIEMTDKGRSLTKEEWSELTLGDFEIFIEK